MNWYRGFFRLWLASSVFWFAGFAAYAIYMSNENAAFQKRFEAATMPVKLPPGATLVSPAEEARIVAEYGGKIGGPLFKRDGSLCTVIEVDPSEVTPIEANGTAESSAGSSYAEPCTTSPQPPYAAANVQFVWGLAFGVPGITYVALRALAWIFRGFQ